MASTEIRRAFHEELDEVGRDIVRLGAMVTESIPRATEALLTNDLAVAQALIDGDDVLDDLSMAIEDQCCRLMTLQQPMATDLRNLVSSFRIVADIERSGDLVTNICKAIRRIYPSDLPPAVRGLIEQMSEHSVRLFRSAMDSYADSSSALAAALDDMDDLLDSLHADYIQAVLSWGGGGDIQAAVQLALVGRYYERLGDHAVNIGERVQYMVDGWLPEHAGAARARARAAAADADADADGDPVGDGQGTSRNEEIG